MDIHIDSSGLIEFLSTMNKEENSENDGLVTTRQICESLNVSSRKALEMLRRLKDQGLVEHGHTWIMSIDNRKVRTNGYRLVPKP